MIELAYYRFHWESTWARFMKSSYQKLCTEFYDLTKPSAGAKEVSFYSNLLGRRKGPFLEAMCGSGRLLIPLLKKGLKVDGIDNSAPMLESCRNRCQRERLSVQLYHQSLQELSLPQKYDLIFIAIGSFQLISDRNEALLVLKKLHECLLPGGQLVIETFIPWDGIKESIQGSSLPEKSQIMSNERKVLSSEEVELIHTAEIILHFKNQLEISRTRYEKWDHGKLVLTEEEDYIVRWYHRYEMELFLEKAGFSTVQIMDESFEQNEHAIIYMASP